jgi:hypothetical protein
LEDLKLQALQYSELVKQTALLQQLVDQKSATQGPEERANAAAKAAGQAGKGKITEIGPDGKVTTRTPGTSLGGVPRLGGPDGAAQSGAGGVSAEEASKLPPIGPDARWKINQEALRGVPWWTRVDPNTLNYRDMVERQRNGGRTRVRPNDPPGLETMSPEKREIYGVPYPQPEDFMRRPYPAPQQPANPFQGGFVPPAQPATPFDAGGVRPMIGALDQSLQTQSRMEQEVTAALDQAVSTIMAQSASQQRLADHASQTRKQLASTERSSEQAVAGIG